MAGLPAGFPWPILITHHFPRDVRSHLPEILARVTPLRVREAVDCERLLPGVVLTSPSGAVLGVTPEGRVAFSPRKRGPPDTVDHLFIAASKAAGRSVVAVVLSGWGWDGAAGTVVVKKNGGTVIAESPETAEWGGMPAAAVAADCVDEILPAPAIAAALVRIATRADRGEAPA
ncbi:MAG TPA: chemotaxis protein CheB [Candidatus Thermoplasmatota archaeon]|nr:chemotaxis protein CheB [Candidatus Thermoplasmatota archaeon]